MSTAARKARKRAGIPFTKPQKSPTPVAERAATRRAADRLLTRVLRRLGMAPSREVIEAAIREEAEK